MPSDKKLRVQEEDRLSKSIAIVTQSPEKHMEHQGKKLI
jgi:hypothetical protein